MKILITCPPMLAAMNDYREAFVSRGIELITPDIEQTLDEARLLDLVPGVDGWIIGDDPATAAVFAAGKSGSLKAAVKWGVGVDNVDFEAARACGIPVTNTPGMFGREVADLAVLYVLALSRDAMLIDREVRAGNWPKPSGISMAGKLVALVGFGDIGGALARRLLPFGMKLQVYDPYSINSLPDGVLAGNWPDGLGQADFIVFTCALSSDTRHMLNAAVLENVRTGVRIVNVARGPLIDEAALIGALGSRKIHSVALDVFEEEPLPIDSPLRGYPRCILGSHNGSNTQEAVRRASDRAVEILFESLGVA